MLSKKAEESFSNCSALFHFYSQLDLKVRRAQLFGNEIAAEPVDFQADVILKIRRALPNRYAASMVERLLTAGKPELVPLADRVKVGQAFINANLEGVYRDLFWKTKNAIDRAVAQDAQAKRTTDEDEDEPDGVADAEIAQILDSANEPLHWVQP